MIAVFYLLGTAVGGIAGPWLFGSLHQRTRRDCWRLRLAADVLGLSPDVIRDFPREPGISSCYRPVAEPGLIPVSRRKARPKFEASV